MKPVIYLASDSTVQSYPAQNFPQTGWGQVLIQFFAQKNESIQSFHPETTQFPHVMRYETDKIAIDNRAFAGRSARSFWNEGRLADMEQAFCRGDYLFIQFAHNDANKKKPERYIPAQEYPLWLERYVKIAHSHGVTPVLITAIAMRTFLPDGTLPISFPAYRNAMLEFAQKQKVPCIDLGEQTRAFCEKLGPEKTKNIFMWTQKGEYPGGPYCEGSEDNAHLKYDGAVAFAGLLAEGIRNCPELTELAALMP